LNICITSSDRDLESEVDQTFGRARYFLFVDSETRETDVVENTPGAHGAGVQAAQLLSERGANVLLTGNVGPNAYQGLKAAGVRVYIGAKGTSKQALENYEAGDLLEATEPTGPGHGGGR